MHWQETLFCIQHQDWQQACNNCVTHASKWMQKSHKALLLVSHGHQTNPKHPPIAGPSHPLRLYLSTISSGWKGPLGTAIQQSQQGFTQCPWRKPQPGHAALGQILDLMTAWPSLLATGRPGTGHMAPCTTSEPCAERQSISNSSC